MASDVPRVRPPRAGAARDLKSLDASAVQTEERRKDRAAVAGAGGADSIRMDRPAIRLGILSAPMNPKLAAVAGPKLGAVIPLEEDRTSVGRDATNRLCLASIWVSRRHCLIERQGGRVTISDLGSHNGTFVNGVPVKERLLAHGDQGRVGDSAFLFLRRQT